MCIWEPAHEGRYPQRQKRALGPLELELQAIGSYLMWVWEPNFSPLKEEQVLLTTQPSP